MKATGSSYAVSRRSIVAGSLVAALIGIGAPYENLLISGSPLSFDHSTPAAVLAFLLFSLLINPLLGALKQRWRFDPAELITVYIMGRGSIGRRRT